MDLRRQLNLLRSWAKVIVLGTVLAGVGAYLVSAVLPKMYESQATLVVGGALTSANPTGEQFQTAQLLSQSYAEIAATRPVLERVMARVGITNVATHDFATTVSASAPRDLPFLTVTARDSDPLRAAEIANVLADELIKIGPTISGPNTDALRFVEGDLRATQQRIESLQAQIEVLLAKVTRTATEERLLETIEARLVAHRTAYAALLQVSPGSSTNQLTVVSSAVPPDGPVSPRPLFNTLIALILGLLISTAAAYLWTRIDDTVKTPADVERATGLATIGVILRMPTDSRRKEFYRLATLLYPRSPAAEAFRSLRTNVEFASLDESIRTIVVTSSIPGEGKTVVASNLAVAFAQSGRSTILVDADLRRPGTHSIFSLANDRGLTDMLRSDETGLSDIAQRTEEPNLTVVTSGTLPANPAELVGSHRMEVIIDRLAESADVVIFDTPPIGAVTDAALLAARANATILVIQPHRAREHVVVHAREALAKVGAHVVGVVLNNISTRDSSANPYFGVYRADELPGASDVTPVTPSDRRAVERPPTESPASSGSSRTTGGGRR